MRLMVDRCVCFDVTFGELKALAEREELSLEQLKVRTGCCTGCTMCEPYVRLMIRTGRTEFVPLSSREVSEVMRG